MRSYAPLLAAALLHFPAPLLAEVSAETVLSRVEALAAEGRALTAVSVAYDFYVSKGLHERAAKLRPRLEELQRDFMRGVGGEFDFANVKQGDTLAGIAKVWNVTHEFLMRVNGISSPHALRAGAAIKTVRGPFSLRISLSQRRAVVYLNEARVRDYPVAVGGPGGERATPAGDYRVLEKVKNPRYDRGAEHYEPLDPRSPVGTRWLRLKGPIGIHGTNEPDSIGKAVSEGCIRLFNSDVEELFDLLVTGSRVIVTGGPAGLGDCYEKGVP